MGTIFSWMVIAALIDEYRHIFLGMLIGIPLCFVNPILGVIAGLITTVCVAHATGD